MWKQYMFNLTTLHHFLLVAWPLPATHFASIQHNRIVHIKFYTQSKRLLLTGLHCSFYTKVASSFGGLQSKWPLVLRNLPLPHAFLNRYSWDWESSQCYIITIMMASFMHVSYTLVFHQSKCISAMRLILSTVATYILSIFFHVFVCSLLLRCMFKV